MQSERAYTSLKCLFFRNQFVFFPSQIWFSGMRRAGRVWRSLGCNSLLSEPSRNSSYRMERLPSATFDKCCLCAWIKVLPMCPVYTKMWRRLSSLLSRESSRLFFGPPANTTACKHWLALESWPTRQTILGRARQEKPRRISELLMSPRHFGCVRKKS